MGRSLTGAGGFVIPGSCVGVESQTPEVSRKVAGGRQTAGPQVDAFIDPGGIAEQVPTSNAVPAARRDGSSLRLCASAGEAGLRVCVPLRNRTCVLGLGVCDPAGVVGLMGPTIRRSFDRRLPSGTPPASGSGGGWPRGSGGAEIGPGTPLKDAGNGADAGRGSVLDRGCRRPAGTGSEREGIHRRERRLEQRRRNGRNDRIGSFPQRRVRCAFVVNPSVLHPREETIGSYQVMSPWNGDEILFRRDDDWRRALGLVSEWEWIRG